MAEEEVIRARIANSKKRLKAEIGENSQIGRSRSLQNQSSTDDDSDLSDKCECCQRVTFPGQNSCVIEPCGHLVCFCCLLEAGMIAFMSRRLPRCPCLEELNCDEPVSKATILDVKDKRKSVSGIWSEILSLMESYEYHEAVITEKIQSDSEEKEQVLCMTEKEDEKEGGPVSFRNAHCPLETFSTPIASQRSETLVSQTKNGPGNEDWQPLLEREIAKSVHGTQWPLELDSKEDLTQNHPLEALYCLKIENHCGNKTEKETDTGWETSMMDTEARNRNRNSAENETNSTEKETDSLDPINTRCS